MGDVVATDMPMLEETPVEPSRAGASEPRTKALLDLAAALREVHQRCPDLPVLAIRWMHLKHPLREPQEQLLQYAMETAGQATIAIRHSRWLSRWRERFDLGWNVLRCVLYGGYLSFHLLRLRLLLWRQVKALIQQRFDVVIRTCCFGTEQPADGNDFYFGDLQDRLTARGLRVVLLCGDARGGRWVAFAQGQITTSGLCRLPELALVPVLAPVRMMLQQLHSCVRLRHLEAGSTSLVREVIRLARVACLSPDTAMTGLLSWVGRAAVQRWHPRALLTLYEGHAWEPCLWRGVRAIDPFCRIVGYQHTAVFRESVSMLRPADVCPGSVPEVVLCLGDLPCELLQPGHASFRTQLVRFGSFRNRHTCQVQQPADPARRTMLVTPEGIVSETTTLFTFAYVVAQRLPSYTVRLRCHPEVPMAKARQLVSVDLTRLPNLILSEGRRIEEDFAQASVLLYRGSSSVLYAIAYGLLPIYQQLHGERDRDPLFMLPDWRKRCATPEELSQVLMQHEQAAPDVLMGEWERALQYVNDYTTSVTEESIQQFVEAAGFGSGTR